MFNNLSSCLKYFLISLFILCVNGLQAQENQAIPNIEKVYVHTDRSSYTFGESIWYKAYSVLAYNHLFFDQSKILYVELISPESKIIARHKTRLDQGLGHGDFKLSDSIGVKKPGVYQLRAYTNWDRNFGDDFVFKKNIEVIDVFKDNSNKVEVDKKSKQKRQSKEEVETKIKRTFQCEFFPEGGNLIENVLCTVAFKATDSLGNPIKVIGKIIDSEGDLITSLSSVHEGMGRFQLTPASGVEYKAEIITETGDIHEFSLPKVSDGGFLLGSNKIKDKDIVIIKTNDKTFQEHKDELIAVVARVRGISYFEGEIVLSGEQVAFELPKDQIPEGICQITIYDKNGVPQSERLLYIDKSDEHDLNVGLSINKKVYKPEEQVEILVTSKTKTGQPASASFSLASIDESSVSDAMQNGTTICSYFLLESDIHGKVHNPGFYFDASNPKRLACLDLLLLTQGWRNFLWKTLPQAPKLPKYPIEKGFPVSGRVKQLLGNKPKPNNTITLALMNDREGIQLFSEVTDSLGRFSFKDITYTGKTTMLVNTKNEKGKGKGELLLDTLESKPLPVNFKYKAVISDTLEVESIKKHAYNKYIAYGVSPENVLDEVEIIAEKKDETPSYYGNPEYKYYVDEETPPFSSIFQLIQYLVPGVMVTNDTIQFMRFNGPAHIILDGFPVFSSDDISYIMPENVDRVEVFKGPSTAIFGADGANGVLLIYTKIGAVNNQPKKEFHSMSKTVEGFYDARVFYTASGEDSEFDLNNNDAIRNTLYWNPFVHPDEKGVVKLNYDNSKVETKVKVTLEGLTITGIPVVKTAEYTIEK
ncbi:TonB-dependent receptor plug domain-containing protein [Aestuariibaculum suncheonense]|uniref:TonB-dependent receptor plug domain-containing protein n=1 Tax=Aestuariibaculum suncheonense TaxID=1028745 RepID=A0A8J6QAS3_9FLAO|nr:TonB-dependent receptor plug domain-containing protein [Aestuariibaculum suncheonense]MBD0836749.1 TonB-dependent receptor plug domain-containing protein [Aestuariibaculum suncheonense]